MFAVPTGENSAVAVDDSDPDAWVISYITFDPLSVEKLSVENLGNVLCATVNVQSQAVWILGDYIQAVSRDLGQGFGVPFPQENVVPFNLQLVGDYFYLCCGKATVWVFDRTVNQWIERLAHGPEPVIPERGPTETAGDYVERTYPIMDRYARENPDAYAAFACGDAHYVIGALGRIVRFRGDEVNELWLDSGARLIHGFEENNQAVICADRPRAEIYKGTFEDGFELLYANDETALHLTAQHKGKRYIGAGQDEKYEGPALFELKGDELVVVETGCAREPVNLIQLVSEGDVLWAIDSAGFFRLKDGGWTLTELSAL
ncbi:hypothetical protein [Yoonia sediminilitoris]|uniref:Uncharacterized protein n=1 Tax=Yoonia sediminilitoris TaxID=1286148 RepID=A0A2T6KM31_9RHOB|nr:hypothetical protein [Yoonia sediminilitoris]PUB17263.1 hypothetical protein C8N45_102275 [Yoonia sediminilitoris]RCW97558.1 hypothetical protein DFP92_102275 [Yoonia sediminilitoris]